MVSKYWLFADAIKCIAFEINKKFVAKVKRESDKGNMFCSSFFFYCKIIYHLNAYGMALIIMKPIHIR